MNQTNQKIYFRHRGRIHGPMDKNQVLKLIDMGQVDEDDSWSRDGLNWQSLEALYNEDFQEPTRQRAAWSVPSQQRAERAEQAEQQVYQGASGEPMAPNSGTWESPLYTQSRLKSWLMPIGMCGIFVAVMVIVMAALKPGRVHEGDPLNLPDGGGGAVIPGALNNPAAPGEGPLNAKQILGKMGNAAALIVRAGDGEPVIGSGFLIRSNLLLTTAAVAGDDRGILIAVYFPNGSGDEKGPHQARIHHSDPVSGFAILRLDAPQNPMLLSEESLLKFGEDLVILASHGLEGPKLAGEIRSTQATYTTTTTRNSLEFHRISGKCKPSFSGAPVIDRRGKVVGMIADAAPNADPLCLGSKQILKLIKDVPLP